MNQRSLGLRPVGGSSGDASVGPDRSDGGAHRTHSGTARVAGVRVLPLTGTLEPSSADDVGRRIRRHIDAARLAKESFVLDLADVIAFSPATAAVVGAVLGDAEGVAVAVSAPGPTVRTVLRARAPALGVHATVADAVRAVSGSHVEGGSAPDVRDHDESQRLRDEVYGMRARARSRGLIGIAQGMVLARYALPDPDSAMTLLRESSQHYNVPLRAFASAVVVAPAPAGPGPWFPHRRQLTPPAVDFLAVGGVRPDQRGNALRAAVEAAVRLADADAGTLHLVDPARGGALFLEAERHHGPAYRDAYARLAPDASDTAVTVARAHGAGRPTAGTEAAPLFFEQRSAAPLFASVFHRVHAVPLLSSDGRCAGVLSVQHIGTDRRLTRAETGLLVSLAADTHAWHSWYQRTVVLDALERLHTHGTLGPD
ncbi:ANTAR domain-containing protein [Actinacidiphila alni]|uniref:ANTAR domain-containing protein n=1 Tax=Actinacidiphila alni TaxID=380248 RepID=UPI0033CB4591